MNNLKIIQELKPIDLNCSIFSVYDYNGLSMQELLCQFFTKINEIIKVQNDVYKLCDWLVNIGIKKEVSEKLEKWLDDGTLGDLINKSLLKEINDKIEENKNKIDFMDKHSPIYVNAGFFNIYKDNLQMDSTQGINDAINYCKSNGGGTVIIPSGKYLIEGSIIVPSEVSLKGNGKDHEAGTIFWRDENTLITKPFIILGNGTGKGARLLSSISDFTIIGDSTVSDCICIKSASQGFHGVSIHDIDIEYFRGVPIMLESSIEYARVQFLEIYNVDVGFDFNTYKDLPANPKTNNTICGGVWLKGFVDGVYIDNCRFTNHIDKNDMVGWLNNQTSYGVRIESDPSGNTPQNNFVIEKTFFRGFKSAVYAECKDLTIKNGYIEHCKSVCYANAKDTSLLLNIHGNHVSGCEKLVVFSDNRALDYKKRMCIINSNGNNINWGVFNKSYLYDVIGEELSVIIYNGYNTLPNTFLNTKFEVSTPNAKKYIYGIVSHNRNVKREILSKPRIEREGGDIRGYYLSPNTDGQTDYGLDIINEDNEKIATFHRDTIKFYSHVTGEKITVLEVDNRGRIYIPNDIVMKGTRGRKFVVALNEGGQLFTQEIE